MSGMLLRSYPSDLSDFEFSTVTPYLPAPCPCGRPWKHLVRDLLNGISYVVRTGCQWRALPHEYPPRQTVYWWFRRWGLDGAWDQLNTAPIAMSAAAPATAVGMLPPSPKTCCVSLATICSEPLKSSCVVVSAPPSPPVMSSPSRLTASLTEPT